MLSQGVSKQLSWGGRSKNWHTSIQAARPAIGNDTTLGPSTCLVCNRVVDVLQLIYQLVDPLYDFLLAAPSRPLAAPLAAVAAFLHQLASQATLGTFGNIVKTWHSS